MAVLHREIFPWNPTWRLRDSGNGRTVRNILEALQGGMLGLEWLLWNEQLLPDGQAIIDFPSLIEKKPNERWAIYFQIKGKQRRDRLANEGWHTYFSLKCIQQAMVVRRFDV